MKYIWIIVLLILFVFFAFKHFFTSYYSIPSNYPHFFKNIPCTKNLAQGTRELYATGAACGLGNMNKTLCQNTLQEVIRQKKYANKTLYGNIDSKKQRYDLFLKLEGAGQQLVQQTLSFWKSRQSPLYQPNAKLIEYACFISLPGSRGQDIHRDTGDSIQHKDAISFGIPLQDITPRMGPLVVKPTGGSWSCIAAQQGQVYGWSQTVEHGGGANSSNTARYVLYFTILYPPVFDINVGGKYSLHPDYQPGLNLESVLYRV